MTTADDHWPTTLERVMSTLEFEIAAGQDKPWLRSKIRGDVSQLPALVNIAVHAAIELDKRVALGDREAPVDRKAILARQDLARAMVEKRAPAFITGYATAYRVQLARILWTAIADAPRRRLEEMARRPS